jgi:hypothetical protein
MSGWLQEEWRDQLEIESLLQQLVAMYRLAGGI